MSQRQHVPGSRDRSQLRVRNTPHKMRADPPRSQRRASAGYDQSRRQHLNEIAWPYRVIERRPEIKCYLADFAHQRDALRTWQCIPCTLAVPIVNEPTHCSKIIATVHSVCDCGRNFRNPDESALIDFITAPQKVERGRFNESQTLEVPGVT